MWRLTMVVGAISFLACSEKQKPLPPAIDDAGVSSLQSGNSDRRSQAVAQAFEKLEWSIGLSRPLYLLEYTPTTGHPLFCNNGRALLDEISKRITAETNRICEPRMSGEADELEIHCRIEATNECPHLYRATLWTELDRAIQNKYRLLGTAWVQQMVCAEKNNGEVTDVARDVQLRVKMGKSFQSVLDQCR